MENRYEGEIQEMKRIRSWEHRANRLRDGRNSDADNLDKLQYESSLKGYHTFQDKHIAGRNPDLLIKYDNQNIVIELDGPIHGYGDESSESKQTKSRNEDYEKQSILIITINEEWCKMYNYKFDEVAHIGLFIMEQIARARMRLNNAI